MVVLTIIMLPSIFLTKLAVAWYASRVVPQMLISRIFSAQKNSCQKKQELQVIIGVDPSSSGLFFSENILQKTPLHFLVMRTQQSS